MSLIAHYRLSDLTDSVGNNDLSVINDGGFLVSGVDGKIGTAYQRVSINDSNEVLRSNNKVFLNGSFTLACWVFATNVNTGSANGLVTFHDHANNSGSGINLAGVNTGNGVDIRISCSTGNGTSRTYTSYYGTSDIRNRWAHLIVRYDSVTQMYSLWVDGVKEKEFAYDQYNIEQYIEIFGWSVGFTTTNYRPAAILDDVRVYDHDISENEIKTISSGLMLHYKMDSEDGSVIDYSGQGYDGVLNVNGATTPTWIEDGYIGKGALQFTGPSDGVLVMDHNDAAIIQDEFSFSLWFESLITAGDGYARIITRDTSEYFGVLIKQNAITQTISLFIKNSFVNIGSVGINEPTHLMCTFNSSSSRIRAYLNGVLVYEDVSFTGWSSILDRDIILGCNSENGLSPLYGFTGLIDDVRIYATELQADDALRLYQRRTSIDSIGNLMIPSYSTPFSTVNVEEGILCVNTTTNVVAFEDNTNVYLNDVLLTTLNKQTPYAATTAMGDILSADKPISTGTEKNGVPFSWAGTQFAYRVDRYDPATVYVYASSYEDAVVDVYRSDNPLVSIETLNIPAGTYSSTTSTSTFQYIIESDSPIVAYYMGSGGNDNMPLYPCTTELYGIPSTTGYIVITEDNTEITIIGADGTPTYETRNRGAYVGLSGYSDFFGNSHTIYSNYPVAVKSQEDGDGGESTPYVPKEAFSTDFVLPDDAEFVVFIGRVERATVDVYDETGTYLDTKTVLAGNMGNGDYIPTKLKIDAVEEAYSLLAGYRFVCSDPQVAIMELVDNETIMYGTGRSYGKTFSMNSKGIIETGLSEFALSENLSHWYPLDGDILDYAEDTVTTSSNIVPQHRGYYFDGQLGTYLDMDVFTMRKEGATLAFWLNLTDTTIAKGIFSRSIDGGFESLIRYENQKFLAETDTNCNVFDSPSFAGDPVIDNEWNHFAIVFEFQKAFWYKNGVFIGEATDYGDANCNPDSPLSQLIDDCSLRYIAGNAYRQVMDGMIADIRFYDKASSATEIAMLHKITDPTDKNCMSQGTDKLYIKKELNEVNL